MKQLTKFLLIGLLVLLYYPTQAQNQKSISSNFGYSDNGFATLFNFTFSNMPRHHFYEVGIYSGYLKERQTDFKIKVNVHTLNLGYFKKINLLSMQSGLIDTYAGIGGVFGWETINGGSQVLPDNSIVTSQDGIIYGGFGALQGDIYLSDKFNLSTRYTHFYHANSDVGKSKFMIGLGLKYIIY